MPAKSTDIVKLRADDARAADIIKNWLRTRSTIEFLGTWEALYNPSFKVVEFDHFRKEAWCQLGVFGKASFIL